MANFTEQNSEAGRTPEDNMVPDFEQSLPDEIITDLQVSRNDNFQPAAHQYGWIGRVESQAQEVALARENEQYAPRYNRGEQAAPGMYANPQNTHNGTLRQSTDPMNMGWAEQQVTNRPTTEHTSQTSRAESRQNYAGRMEVLVNQQNFQQTVQKANYNPAPISQAYPPIFANGIITTETAQQGDDLLEADWTDLVGVINKEEQSTRNEKQAYPTIDLTNDEPESKKAFSPPTLVLKKPGWNTVMPQERGTIPDNTRSMRICEDSPTVKNCQSTTSPASQAVSTAHPDNRKRKKAFMEGNNNWKVSKNATNVAYSTSNTESSIPGFLEVAPQQNYQAYPNGGQPACNIGQNAMHTQQPRQSASCGSDFSSHLATDDSQTLSYATNSMYFATPSTSDQSYPDSTQRTQQMQPTTRGEQTQGLASMNTVIPAMRMQREAEPIRAQEMTAAAQTTAPSYSHAQPLTRAILTDNPLYYPPPDNTQSQTPTTHTNLSSQYQPTFQGPLTRATPAHQSQLTYGALSWENQTSSYATYSQATTALLDTFMGTPTDGYSGQGSTRTQQQNWSHQFAPIAVPDRNESEVAKKARLHSFSTNSKLASKYHRLVKILAVDNGYGLIRQDRMKCGDERCAMQHIVPGVLEKDAKDVAWHTPACRYFNASRPCKHCVKWSGECVGCPHCSQDATSKTF